MKFREYVSAKSVTLCFLAIGAVLLWVFLALGSVSAAMIAFIEGFFVLLVVLWLLCGYLVQKNRFKRLRHMIEGVSEPYLLGELLPVPVNPIERQYFEIMKCISRSAIETAEAAIRDKEDYCQYVEGWIHEMKTPLTACSLILSNDANPRKLRRELKRADNLTECILYYARLRTGEKDLQIKEIQVAPVMEEAVKSQMELLIAAGISVETTGDFTVYTDSKPLCFILKQLLVNCAKYCPGCQVTLCAENGVISVRDNGIGIPSHEIRRVTERGFTGTNGKRTGGSTGMGLYIVKALCKSLDIKLTIESELSQYTLITLAFKSLTKV